MSRVVTLDQACARRAARGARRGTLAVTNGCFDVLHAGHAALLAAAAEEADYLWVLVNSDASVRALKGPTRPVNCCEHRTALLCALRSVDAVIVFEGADCARELAALAPDVYVKSAEYAGSAQHPAEAAALAACGTQVVWVERGALSTTAILGRLAAAEQAEEGGKGARPSPAPSPVAIAAAAAAIAAGGPGGRVPPAAGGNHYQEAP